MRLAEIEIPRENDLAGDKSAEHLPLGTYLSIVGRGSPAHGSPSMMMIRNSSRPIAETRGSRRSEKEVCEEIFVVNIQRFEIIVSLGGKSLLSLDRNEIEARPVLITSTPPSSLPRIDIFNVGEQTRGSLLARLLHQGNVYWFHPLSR